MLNVECWTFAVLFFFVSSASAAERFPHPEFETDYTVPPTAVDGYAPAMPPLADIIAITVALVLAAFLVLRVRKRKWIFMLMLACLAYFGFLRKGCVCPVGSIQSVSSALFTAGGSITIVVLVYFVLPLVMALVSGRTFCSSVCPLGGLQDLVILKPVHLPRWLREGLGLFRYFWLGFGVLLAAVGAGYFICRYDPLVGFFRMEMSAGFFLFGAAVLGLGTVVARPYCRFMCPYGVLLGWFSRLSARHLTTTPGECVACGLCPQSCPFDAIDQPERVPAPRTRDMHLRRLAYVLAAVPLILAAGAAAGYALQYPAAELHPTLVLVKQLHAEDTAGAAMTEESKAYRMSGRPAADLYGEAAALRQRIRIGSVLLGLFLGLVVCAKLVRSLVVREHDDYHPDKGRCFSCGRCVEVCPVEHTQRTGAQIPADETDYADM